MILLKVVNINVKPVGPVGADAVATPIVNISERMILTRMQEDAGRAQQNHVPTVHGIDVWIVHQTILKTAVQTLICMGW